MSHARMLLTLALLLAFLLPLQAQAQPPASAYTLTDLGHVIVASLDPTAPVVVGTFLAPDQLAAILYPTPLALGTLPDGLFSMANATVNGVVAGLCGTGPFSLFTHACVAVAGTGFVDLQTLGAPDLFSASVSVNAAGIVAGYGEVPDRSHLVPILWDNFQPRVLRTPTDEQSAFLTAINDAGYSVGAARFEDGRFHATLWGFTEGVFDLGADSEAIALNNSDGAVVVQDTGSDGVRTAIYRSDGKHLLLPLPGASESHGVDAPSTVSAATLWDAEDQPVALQPLVLNSEGWHLDRAVSINALGLIAGQGTVQTASGPQQRGFLLTPVANMVEAGAVMETAPIENVSTPTEAIPLPVPMHMGVAQDVEGRMRRHQRRD